MTRAFVLAVGLFSVTLSIATPVAASDAYVKGRLQGYRGLYEFHIAAMPSRDIADDAGVLAWSTADRETGKFDLVLPPGTKQVYLMGQLDLERMGPRLNGSMTFFLRKLPVYPEDHLNERLLFDLGDMEMAFVTRDAGWSRAVWIALGLAALLYGIGFLWVRRLPAGTAPVRPVIERGGRALPARARRRVVGTERTHRPGRRRWSCSALAYLCKRRCVCGRMGARRPSRRRYDGLLSWR